MDLGQIFTVGAGMVGAYQQARYQQPSTTFLGNTPSGGYQQTLGVPFVDVIPEASSCGKQLWDPRANCGQGKWIKKSRKRRRRLATLSDISDLSRLKGVLGGGKAFETWIATH